MNSITQARTLLERKKGEKAQIVSSIKNNRIQVRELGREIKNHEKAREIVRLIATQIQSQLQFYLSDITSLALKAIFPNPYQLRVEFVQRRNKTECDLFLEKEGELFSPLSDLGGGIIDVASFSLRLTLWSLRNPKTRNIIILDEPLRFLSDSYQENASLLIQELSKRLNLQFIIVTHSEKLAERADNIITVSQSDRVSLISN